MIYILLIMIWEISLIFVFAGGFLLGGKKKCRVDKKSITAQDLKDFNKRQKEQENFMAYDGTPQDAIND